MGFLSLLLYSTVAASIQPALAAPSKNGYDYVDPLIGTINGGMLSPSCVNEDF